MGVRGPDAMRRTLPDGEMGSDKGSETSVVIEMDQLKDKSDVQSLLYGKEPSLKRTRR